jgi:sugar lactone lactonase YvrE
MLNRHLIGLLGALALVGVSAQSGQAQIAIPAPNYIGTIAGPGSSSLGDGGLAIAAKLGAPYSVAVDKAGNVYIADTFNNRIRKVTASNGLIVTVAGTGTQGYSGDGGLATSAKLNQPYGIAVDSAGNLYVTDTGNYRVRKIMATSGVISTIAGTGTQGSSGDGGPATSATLYHPFGIAVTASGQVYFSDNQSLRVIDSLSGTISLEFTVASSVEGVAVDSSGNVFVALSDQNQVAELPGGSAAAAITVAGTDEQAYNGDGGLAVNAALDHPEGVAIDSLGNLYISETDATYVVRKVVLSSGIISTVVGPGTPSNEGDGGLATSAYLSYPLGLAVDISGNLYIAEMGGNRIRVVGESIPTSTTVSSSNSSTYYGAALTLTANVSATSGTPTGTVAFYSDGSSLGSGSLAGGTASLTTRTLSIGSHSITAAYAGVVPYLASTSAAIGQTITTIPTGVVFTASPNPAVVTNSVAIQAQVSATDGSSPTGVVSIVADGNTVIGTPSLSGGLATASTSTLAVGTHNITVSYLGGGNYASSSVTQPLSVILIPTTTAVTPSTSSASFGQCVTLTANVASSSGSPAGTVSFSANSGSISLGTATLSAGIATVSTCSMTPGTYSISAAYSGATTFATSSGTTSFRVTQATPFILWSSPADITYGTPLSASQLSATVASVAGTFTYSPGLNTVLGAGVHTLSVLFTPNDTTDYTTASASVSINVKPAVPTLTWVVPAAITYGTPLSTLQLNATASVPGTFVYTPSLGAVLTPGTQPLTVVFTPTDSTDYTTATTTVPLTVNKAAAIITGTSSPSPSIYGDQVTFTLAAAANGSGVLPTGTLAISDGSDVIQTVTLVNGSATYKTAGLDAGTHTLTVTYSGDTNYQ